MVEEKKLLTVGERMAGQRLDVFVASLSGLSRSRVQKLVADGMVTLGGRPARASYRVKAGEVVRLAVPEPRRLELRAEQIDLDVVYEDEDVVVVDKPRGMVVHPAPGNYSGTLVHALLARCPDLAALNDVVRPGIVHRLDKDTTGLIVVAKNARAHAGLARQVKERAVRRGYIALVHGVPSSGGGVIAAPIGRHPVQRQKMAVVQRGGREAVTHFRVLERLGEFALLKVWLETGRTHQIRVHMAYIGHPVVGDRVYGRARSSRLIAGQALHAAELEFRQPVTGEMLRFTSPAPADMQSLVERLRNGLPADY